jgi:hypothetical protein
VYNNFLVWVIYVELTQFTPISPWTKRPKPLLPAWIVEGEDNFPPLLILYAHSELVIYNFSSSKFDPK